MQTEPRLVNICVSEDTLKPLANRKRSFRMRQVFKCTICGSQTNLAQGTGISIDVDCPNIEEEWHATLTQKLRRLRETGHPEYYMKELNKEVTALKKNHSPKMNIRGKTRGRPRYMNDFGARIFSYPND